MLVVRLMKQGEPGNKANEALCEYLRNSLKLDYKHRDHKIVSFKYVIIRFITQLQQPSDTSADIPNISGTMSLVRTKQAANDSAGIGPCSDIYMIQGRGQKLHAL